jgi:Protein of unknown function (DUF1761)
MELNFTAVIVATVVQFILGALWYGPIFGKQYMQIMGVAHLSEDEIKKMQKAMAPFYGLQLFLTLLSTIALSCVITYFPQKSAMMGAFMVWFGFVAPTQISGVIWGNTKQAQWLKQILIMMSFSLTSLMLAAGIISWWM